MSKSISVSVRALMERMRAEQRAVTFDDVSLADAPSAVHPNDVGLGAHITRKYRVPVPLLGAAMDTVTEAELALELARCGGVGILHRNLSAAEQARQLSWVRLKVHSGGMIEKPIMFCTEDQLSTVEEALREHRWSFSTFPIVSNDGALAGILGRNEMAFASSASSANPRLSDLMKPIADIVHSRPCSAQEAQTLMREKRVRKLPIVGEDGGLAGLYVWKDVCAALRDSEAALDEEGHYLVGAAVSSAESDMARVDALMSAGCRILVLDSSHGASAEAVAQVKRIRARYSDVQIIVGNIASYNSARYILQETQGQVDALKIGIGPGSICTTRQVTGHGVPQLTALYESWLAVQAHVAGGGAWLPLIADGGVRTSGDLVKAWAFGASAIMLGSALACADESAAPRVERNGQVFKLVRGMASAEALGSHSGSRERYFAGGKGGSKSTEAVADATRKKLVPEGVQGLVASKGPLANILQQLCGGARSGLAHSGASTLDALLPTVWLQTNSGATEGRPHTIQ